MPRNAASKLAKSSLSPTKGSMMVCSMASIFPSDFPRGELIDGGVRSVRYRVRLGHCRVGP